MTPRQKVHEAATVLGVLMLLFGSHIAAESVCQWAGAGAVDPALEQTAHGIGGPR